jgi:hypothetical protein
LTARRCAPTSMRPAPKKEGPQAIGRSRGGLTSKIHAVVDALGNPVRWLLSGGEVADITQAKPLLDGLKADAVLADKGYDADALIDLQGQTTIMRGASAIQDRAEAFGNRENYEGRSGCILQLSRGGSAPRKQLQRHISSVQCPHRARGPTRLVRQPSAGRCRNSPGPWSSAARVPRRIALRSRSPRRPCPSPGSAPP